MIVLSSSYKCFCGQQWAVVSHHNAPYMLHYIEDKISRADYSNHMFEQHQEEVSYGRVE